jgi:hypothetical protein
MHRETRRYYDKLIIFRLPKILLQSEISNLKIIEIGNIFSSEKN